MKKYFAFVAASLMLVSLASCNKKGGNDPEPEQDAAFKIEVSDVAATSVNVKVTPSDLEKTYFFSVFAAEDIAGLADTAIISAVKDQMDYLIMYYEYFYGKTYTYADFLKKGVQSGPIDELSPKTNYVVLAFYMDEEGVGSAPVIKKAFTTPELVAEKTEDINLTDAECIDACEAGGWWQLFAAPADSSYVISISPIEASQLEGEWTMDDMDAEYTYIAFADRSYADFVSMNVQTKVENDLFILTGTALATNAVEYHFNISAKIEVKVPNGGGAEAPARNVEKGKITMHHPLAIPAQHSAIRK